MSEDLEYDLSWWEQYRFGWRWIWRGLQCRHCWILRFSNFKEMILGKQGRLFHRHHKGRKKDWQKGMTLEVRIVKGKGLRKDVQ